MPSKYRKTKKKKSYNVKRKMRKSKYGASAQLVTFRPSRSMQPFPPRFRTKFYCDAEFYVNAGNLSTGGSMYIGGNFMEFPFNCPGYADQGNFNSIAPNYIVPSSGVTRVLLKPTGFSALLSSTGVSTPYTTYRVYASSIEVDCIPQSVTDVTDIGIVPVAQSSQPSTVQRLGTTQFGKIATIGAMAERGDKGNKGHTLKNYMSTEKFFGVTKQAVQSSFTDFTGGPGTPPTQMWVWKLMLDQADQQGTTQAIAFRVRTCYYVELFWQSESSLIIN